MAYTNFTLDDLEARFGIRNRRERLFGEITPVPTISDWLAQTLKMAESLSVKSEKARSELLVSPILLELRMQNNDFFTVYSGDMLNVDEEKGLNGECDFIVAKDTGSFTVNYPILQLVEAKKQDIEVGVPQCAAQMVGARLFNERKGQPIDVIYGCVTTGDDWLFLRLDPDGLIIDTRKFYLGNLGQLLGAFQIVFDFYRKILA